jgi:hypothetical protein
MGGTPSPPAVANYTIPSSQLYGASNAVSSGAGAFTSSPFSDITSLAGNINPYVSNLFGAGNVQAPSAAPAIGASQQIGPQMMTLGESAFGAGQGVVGAGQSLIPYAQTLATMGMDPQQQLYNTYLSNTLNQSGAVAAGATGNSPYSVSEVGQADANFNTAWNQYILQNAISGANAAGGLVGQAGNTIGAGYNIAGGGLGTAMQGALLPYSTGQQVGGQSLQDLSSAFQLGTSAASLPQMSVQDYLNYLGAGNQANAVYNQGNIGAYNAQTQAQLAQFQELSMLGGGVTNLAMLGGALGPFGAFGAFSSAVS